MKKTVMQDQEIMQDLLISENRMTTTYNQFTNECASQQIHDQFQNLLNEERVAVVPGNAFGESGEGFIRCSYAYSIENIQEALKRIERFVKNHSK